MNPFTSGNELTPLLVVSHPGQNVKVELGLAGFCIPVAAHTVCIQTERIQTEHIQTERIQTECIHLLNISKTEHIHLLNISKLNISKLTISTY